MTHYASFWRPLLAYHRLPRLKREIDQFCGLCLAIWWGKYHVQWALGDSEQPRGGQKPVQGLGIRGPGPHQCKLMSSALVAHLSIGHLVNQCVDQPLRWAIHTVKPLSTFVHSRVALIGDAVCPTLMLYAIIRQWFMPYAGTCNAPDPGLGCRTSNRGGFYSKSTEPKPYCSHGHPIFLELTAGRIHSGHSPRKSQDRQKRCFGTTCPKSIWRSAMLTCSRGSGAVKNEWKILLSEVSRCRFLDVARGGVTHSACRAHGNCQAKLGLDLDHFTEGFIRGDCPIDGVMVTGIRLDIRKLPRPVCRNCLIVNTVACVTLQIWHF